MPNNPRQKAVGGRDQEFVKHKNIRTVLNQRLIAEGRHEDYRFLVQRLKLAGLDASGPMAAWKVGAFPYAPLGGGPGEIYADAAFEKIRAYWEQEGVPEPSGFARFPNGLTNFQELEQEPSPELKELVKQAKASAKDAPKRWDEEWADLAAAVGDKVATEAEEARWVAGNYLTEIDLIDAASVPSTAALGILSWVKQNPSNYGDFLRMIYAKLIKTTGGEVESRLMDDGREELALLAEFERGLEAEHGTER